MAAARRRGGADGPAGGGKEIGFAGPEFMLVCAGIAGWVFVNGPATARRRGGGDRHRRGADRARPRQWRTIR